MAHLPELIGDLALILIAGAVTTLVFRKIKQPLVLGYIIAGFLVGPHFQLIPTVADTENIDTLAEMGVIFLLFSLGLEFSFKKLMRVGGRHRLLLSLKLLLSRWPDTLQENLWAGLLWIVCFYRCWIAGLQ